MSTPIGAANEGGENGQDDSGINPAWNDVLSAVPEDAHSQITPHLRNWDQNFQRVQSDFAPYKEFKEAGVTADQIKMGMGLMQALEQNPKQVYDLLAQQFNFSADSGQGDAEPQEDDVFGDLPEAVKSQLALVPQLQQQLDTLTQWAVQNQQGSAEAQEDEALENLMGQLRQTHGDFDEHYVLSKMQAGQNAEDAIKDYQAFVERISTEAQRPKAPKILGSGSIIPGEQSLNVNKMDPKQTKDYVAQLLAHNAAQNR
jgi:small-conductance mechanosensitive channel